jgi:hypothetical protein
MCGTGCSSRACVRQGPYNESMSCMQVSRCCEVPGFISATAQFQNPAETQQEQLMSWFHGVPRLSPRLHRSRHYPKPPLAHILHMPTSFPFRGPSLRGYPTKMCHARFCTYISLPISLLTIWPFVNHLVNSLWCKSLQNEVPFTTLGFPPSSGVLRSIQMVSAFKCKDGLIYRVIVRVQRWGREKQRQRKNKTVRLFGITLSAIQFGPFVSLAAEIKHVVIKTRYILQYLYK